MQGGPLETFRKFRISLTVPKKSNGDPPLAPSGFVTIKMEYMKGETLCTNLDAFPLAGPVV